MSAESTTVALERKPAAFARDWRTPLELLLLGAIWGGSFLFMRIAATPFGAFALVDIRLAWARWFCCRSCGGIAPRSRVRCGRNWRSSA